MSGRARPARRWGRAVCLAAALLIAPPVILAGVETKVVGGEKTFVIRPDRKPGASASPAEGRAPIPRAASREVLRLVEEVSLKHDLDPRLVSTVISVESGFNQMAVSPKGARGLMQLMPGTARQYGVDNVHDPKQNVEAGVAYLKDLQRRYNGDLRLALAAYNAGPEAVARAAGVPDYRETIDYLGKIEKLYGRSLTVASLDPDRAAGGDGSIRATRAEDGTIVLTNRKGSGVRIIQPAAGAKR